MGKFQSHYVIYSLEEIEVVTNVSLSSGVTTRTITVQTEEASFENEVELMRNLPLYLTNNPDSVFTWAKVYAYTPPKDSTNHQ